MNFWILIQCIILNVVIPGGSCALQTRHDCIHCSFILSEYWAKWCVHICPQVLVGGTWGILKKWQNIKWCICIALNTVPTTKILLPIWQNCRDSKMNAILHNFVRKKAEFCEWSDTRIAQCRRWFWILKRKCYNNGQKQKLENRSCWVTLNTYN